MAGRVDQRRVGQSRRPGRIVRGVALLGVSAAMPDRPPAQQHTTPQMEEGEVAESNRRGKRAVDEHPEDEVLADAVADDEPDDFDADGRRVRR